MRIFVAGSLGKLVGSPALCDAFTSRKGSIGQARLLLAGMVAVRAFAVGNSSNVV